MHATTTRSSNALILALLLVGGSFFGSAGLGASDEPIEAARIAVGQQAPEFTLPTATGVELGLSDLRGEKNVVLVFFRGTW